MGQKVHPIGFRLGITKQHQSKWYTNPKKYAIFIEQERFLRKLLFDKYSAAGISSIEMERKVHQISINMQVANPRMIAVKDDLQVLRQELEKQLHKYMFKNVFCQQKYQFFQEDEKPTQISIVVTKISQPNADVTSLTQFLVDQLEQRAPFRRAIRQTIQRAQRQKIPGIKIQISGRLNGAEMARSEWVREGKMPLQTLRADIDYCYKTAKTIYGLLGIKVWVFSSK